MSNPTLLSVLCGSLVCLAAIASPAHSQAAPATGSASATVVRALQALDEQRWNDVAALVDTASLRRFRRQQVQQAVTEEQMPQMAARADSLGLPPAFREMLAGLSGVDIGEPIAKREFGVANVAALTALTETELFTRWLERNDRKVRRERVNSGVAGGIEQAIGVPIPRLSPAFAREVIGEVPSPRGERAFVVFQERVAMAAFSTEETRVAELIRHGDGWRLLITKGLFDNDLMPELMLDNMERNPLLR